MNQLFALTRHRKLFQPLVLGAGILGLCSFAAAKQPTIITFDPPGSVATGVEQINLWGTIVGLYADANGVYHGFRRTPNGNITSYDAPDAGEGPGQGTILFSINTFGVMGGTSNDSNNVLHSFLLTPQGKYTVFDAPDAGRETGQGTELYNINDLGEAAGGYIDAGDWTHGTAVWHGFLRAADGKVKEYDAPGAGTGLGQGTSTCGGDCLNNPGTIAGGYWDALSVLHAYVRSKDGDITEFDPPGSTYTNPSGIDLRGDVVGAYTDANGVYHGFFRDKDGHITDIDVPGAGTGNGQGTIVNDIADGGAAVGNYIDANNVYHGFLRAPNGAITKIDVPAAGKGAGQGTTTGANNALGLVAGSYIDSNNVYHGFLWIPCDDDHDKDDDHHK